MHEADGTLEPSTPIAARRLDRVRGSSPLRNRITWALWDMAYRWWDMLLLAALITLANAQLAAGGNTDFWAFYPRAVAAGQWWRLLTNDFAHNSLYHLLVVGPIFWALYLALEERRPLCRLAYVFLSGAGSSLFAMLFEPPAGMPGMRGLSGVTHGLLGICALELALSSRRSLRTRSLAAAALLLIIAKVICELALARSLFETIHLGNVGVPNVSCHAGGLLAGLLALIGLRASGVGNNRRFLARLQLNRRRLRPARPEPDSTP